MPDYIKAPDGAYLFRASEVEIIKDELGRPIVTFKSAGTTAVKSVNGKTGDVQISCVAIVKTLEQCFLGVKHYAVYIN